MVPWLVTRRELPTIPAGSRPAGSRPAGSRPVGSRPVGSHDDSRTMRRFAGGAYGSQVCANGSHLCRYRSWGRVWIPDLTIPLTIFLHIRYIYVTITPQSATFGCDRRSWYGLLPYSGYQPLWDLLLDRLSGSQLSGSQLSGSQLSGSKLSGSKLSGSKLSGSQLASNHTSIQIPFGFSLGIVTAALDPEACNASTWDLDGLPSQSYIRKRDCKHQARSRSQPDGIHRSNGM